MKVRTSKRGKIIFKVVTHNEPSVEALEDLNKTLERLFEDNELKAKQIDNNKDVVPA
jgi:hypothetical protein